MTAIYPSQTTWPAPGHSLNIRIFTPGVLLYLFHYNSYHSYFCFCFICCICFCSSFVSICVISFMFLFLFYLLYSFFVHFLFHYALYHSYFCFCFIPCISFCLPVYLFPQYKYRYVLTLKSYNNGYTRSVYKCKWSFK